MSQYELAPQRRVSFKKREQFKYIATVESTTRIVLQRWGARISDWHGVEPGKSTMIFGWLTRVYTGPQWDFYKKQSAEFWPPKKTIMQHRILMTCRLDAEGDCCRDGKRNMDKPEALRTVNNTSATAGAPDFLCSLGCLITYIRQWRVGSLFCFATWSSAWL